MARKKRVENGFRRTTTQNNTFSPVIKDAELVDAINNYCEHHDINKTNFVCDCIRSQIEILEQAERRAILESMSKEEMAEIILSNGWRCA